MTKTSREFLGQSFYGCGVLRRRHAGHFAELPRKILDRSVSQPAGDLGDRQICRADHGPGLLDLHLIEMVDDSAAGLFFVDRTKEGTAY